MKKLLIVLILLLNCSQVYAQYFSTGGYDVFVTPHSVNMYEQTSPQIEKLKSFFASSCVVSLDKQEKILQAVKPQLKADLKKVLSKSIYYKDFTFANDVVDTYSTVFQSTNNSDLFLITGDLCYKYRNNDITRHFTCYIQYSGGQYNIIDNQINL